MLQKLQECLEAFQRPMGGSGAAQMGGSDLSRAERRARATCWTCKQKGHYRCECDRQQSGTRNAESTPPPQTPTSQKWAVAGLEWLNPATKLTNAPVTLFKTSTLKHTGDGLLVQGCVDGKKCITIDTGSNISIVRPDILGKHARRAMQWRAV